MLPHYSRARRVPQAKCRTQFRWAPMCSDKVQTTRKFPLRRTRHSVRMWCPKGNWVFGALVEKYLQVSIGFSVLRGSDYSVNIRGRANSHSRMQIPGHTDMTYYFLLSWIGRLKECSMTIVILHSSYDMTSLLAQSSKLDCRQTSWWQWC